MEQQEEMQQEEAMEQHKLRKQRLSHLYEAWSDDLYRYFRFHVQNEQLAEELTQETYIRAFQGLISFQGKSREKTWLLSIARHVKLDYFRRKRVERLFWKQHGVAQQKEEHKKVATLPLEEMESNEQKRALYQAIGKLKRNYQEVIYLRKIKELPIQETSKVLDWSESKVKNTLARALKALTREMKRKRGNEEEESG